MANASTMSPFPIKDNVANRSPVITYLQNYGAGKSIKGIPSGTDFRFRSVKNVEENDFRKVTVDLDNFNEIIERIEKLRLERKDRKEIGEARSTSMLCKHDDASQEKSVNDSLARLVISESRNIPAKENQDEDVKDEEKKKKDSCHSENEDEDESSKLIERGPIRPQFYSAGRDLPYSTVWPCKSFEKNKCDSLDYDASAKEIFRDKEYSEKLNLCLDQLEGSGEHCRFAVSNSFMENSSARTGQLTGYENYLPGKEVGSLPAIVVDNAGEDSLLEILTRGGFQPAQAFSDSSNNSANSVTSPGTQIWPDSPVHNYNIVVSRSESRASSRAQSPGSATNLGSPIMHGNLTCSPVGSPQIGMSYRVPQALSSSSSSNQSYAETPSPSSYYAPLNPRLEDLETFQISKDDYESSGTVVNSAEIPLSNELLGLSANQNANDIDSNELQLLEEVLRDLGDKYETEEAQVVPTSHFPTTCESQINGHCSPKIETRLCSNSYNYANTVGDYHRTNTYNVPLRERPTLEEELACLVEINGLPLNKNHEATSLNNGAAAPPRDLYAGCQRNYAKESSNAKRINTNQNPDLNLDLNINGIPQYEPKAIREPDLRRSPRDMESAHLEFSVLDRMHSPRSNHTFTDTYGRSSTSVPSVFQGFEDHAANQVDATPGRATDGCEEFQIPEVVARFDSCRRRRNTDRTIMPWPSLNLPSVRASERLKEKLNPKDVEKAMSSLLKKSIEELARPDEDGDTMLMCLVGNPEELATKKAYLAPLVERLGNVKGALSMTNNRGEDALYLAAMNCPRMSYAVGYLAAAMLQKGIDVNQRLYHTRGDTLIHSVASQGDSHGEVLAELLALRTSQGNAVFDLSKRNYDGKTALHVAVESHDPTGKGLVSVATVRLLLENGADPKVKETKCGDTALHMAISFGCDPALVKVLLANVSPDVVNTTNYNHNTALHVAAAVASSTVSLERQKEICWLLLQAGGRTNLQNRQGKTPLGLVAHERKESIKRIFYKKPA